MRHLSGIDFGGGASKATLLSEESVICATNTAEQNPDDWVRATCKNIKSVLEKSGRKMQ